jgi:anti-sigma factor RsiW
MRSTHPFEQEEVMAYLDGEIAIDRAAEIAQHMQQCPECQALAVTFRNLSQQFASWEIESSPARLTELVLGASETNRTEKKKSPTKLALEYQWDWRQVFVSPYTWAFACILVAVLIVGKVTLNAPRESSQVVRLAQEEAKRVGELSYSMPAGARKAGGGGGGGQTRAGSESKDLPLNGRNSQYFVQAKPGVAAPAPPPLGGGATAPMIARTASLSIVVKDIGSVESAVKSVTARHSGYIGDLNTTTPPDAAKTFSATLRIPSAQLDAALTDLKQLGRVDQETQSGEEVTKQYTDLVARLKNSRSTEQRLLDVLRNNTGKVKDVLEVENEISRVRGEIEEMEADQRGLQSRVDFATITLSIAEEYKASLQGSPRSTGMRLHNSFVEGYRAVVENVIGLLAWLLEAGPTLLLWAAILFVPARWAWKRIRRALTTAPKPAAA